MNRDPNVIALRGHEAKMAKSQADQERIIELACKYEAEERRDLQISDSLDILINCVNAMEDSPLIGYVAMAYGRGDTAAMGRIVKELIDTYLEKEGWILAKARAEAEVKREDEAPWLEPNSD